MDFIEEINALAAKIPKVKDSLHTEEATKIHLVIPFIYRVLGYDINDPAIFVPELTADCGTGKAAKVDFGICIGGEPVILFECKWSGNELMPKDEDQLRNYFQNCKSSRLGVVTNGIKYRFFTDLDYANLMDERPFLEINLLDIKEPLVQELKRFTSTNFQAETLAGSARELRHMKEIKGIIDREFNKPSDEFVRFFAGEVYKDKGKKITKSVIETFQDLTKRAFGEYINDKIAGRLERAKRDEEEIAKPPEPPVLEPPPPIDLPTDEEKEAYHIVRAIICQVASAGKIYHRKSKSRLDILFENTNRKPLCRLYFDNEPKEIGLLDGNKTETKQRIQELSDIYRFSEELKTIATHYLTKPVINGNHTEEPETLGE